MSQVPAGTASSRLAQAPISGFCSSGSEPGFQISHRVFSETSTGPSRPRTFMRRRPLALSSVSLSRTLALTSLTAPESGRSTGDISVARSAGAGTPETPSFGISVTGPVSFFEQLTASATASNEMLRVPRINWRMCVTSALAG